MTDDTLQRFYGALVEALRERGPADLERPFTVAEIYQDLVPYRTHRDTLGVEMNGDYEHALLRLLAGEGGYLKIESELAQREIRQELDEVDPNTALYRDFAAVDVRLEPDAIPEFDDAAPVGAVEPAEVAEDVEAPPTPFAPGFKAGSDTTESTGGIVVDADPEAEKGPATVAAGEAAPELSGTEQVSYMPEDGACRWCRSDLPDRDNLRYCPYCGADQALSPCRACGEAMEQDWQFCIVCGVQAAE